MRLFIAVPVDGGVREHVSALIAEFRKSGADCKWVEPENLHVTMAFLGELDEAKIPEIEAALAQAVKGQGPIPAVYGGTGTFDSGTHRVVWLGMSQGGEMMTRLGETLLAALRKAGFKVEERPFHPHITIGRLRSTKNVLKLNEKLRAANGAASPAAVVDKLVLFQSRLTDKGPTYTVLRERALDA